MFNLQNENCNAHRFSPYLQSPLPGLKASKRRSRRSRRISTNESKRVKLCKLPPGARHCSPSSRRVTASAGVRARSPNCFSSSQRESRSRSRVRGGAMAHAERFVKVLEGTSAPGPQTYNKESANDRVLKDSVRVPISKAARFKQQIERKDLNVPGPQSYKKESAIDRILRDPIRVPIPRAARFRVRVEELVDISPGPGYYKSEESYDKAVGKQSSKAVIPRSKPRPLPQLTASDIPGPVHYDTGKSFEATSKARRSKSVSFATATRKAPVFIFPKIYK